MPRIAPRSEEELLLAKQRRNLRDLSRRIKWGDPLGYSDRCDAAAVIKAWADQCMNWQPPKRRPGQEPKADPAAVAFRFAALIHGDNNGENKVKPNRAYEIVAEEFGFNSITSVKKIIAARGEEAEMWVAGEVMPKSKKSKS